MSTIDFVLAVPRRATGRHALPYLVAFAAAALGAGLGRAVTTSYLPLLLSEIRDAPGLIGMVMLVNAAAGMFVPLVVGLWSDRRRARGGGRRMPFVVGGALVSGGGLAAVALGFSSSYLVLAVAGAVVYIGLNAVTTAHRALIPETFGSDRRARATSAQELAMLVGGLLGIAVGGGLTAFASWAPFALAAVLVPLLALPTASRTHEADPEPVAKPRDRRPTGYYLQAAARPRVASFLLAQILWVLGYAALPAFFILCAERVLDLAPAAASIFLAGFGVATGAAILVSGRVKSVALHRPLLALGVGLMGAGLLGVAASTSLVVVAVALVAAATGFGLISTLGFPLFSELIPKGEAGGYTALYFSVRSISSTIALPAAGGIIAVTGSYRALFVAGGIATLLALVPLLGTGSLPKGWTVRWTARVVALYGGILGAGLAVAATPLHELDERVFRFVNGFGPGPDLVWRVLDPHTRNYILLLALAGGAAALGSLASVPRVLSHVLASALLAWGLLEAVYAAYERDRPEEVFGPSAISLNGHTWARLESFPSGHMAITAALAVAIAILFPRLRWVLWAYVAAVAFTRVLFGAHFPLDVIAGTILGAASAYLVAGLAGRLVDAHGRRRAGVRGRPQAAALSTRPAHAAGKHEEPRQLVTRSPLRAARRRW